LYCRTGRGKGFAGDPDIIISTPKPELFPVKLRKAIPHEFVLEALTGLPVRTNPMFGCLAVYVREKIVVILRDKPSQSQDNGVWLATTAEHHESLRLEFPHMRSIKALGAKVTGWQILPVDAPDFEESVLRAVELVTARDPRIGKVPKPKRKRTAAKRPAARS
jgi:hypothetical protein